MSSMRSALRATSARARFMVCSGNFRQPQLPANSLITTAAPVASAASLAAVFCSFQCRIRQVLSLGRLSLNWRDSAYNWASFLLFQSNCSLEKRKPPATAGRKARGLLGDSPAARVNAAPPDLREVVRFAHIGF